MAKKHEEPGDVPVALGQPNTIVTTVMLTVAATAAVAGFGVLFSMWWQAGITDKYEKLRIASQEFVAGRPIVAGDLAETVEFEQPIPVAGGDEAEPNEAEPDEAEPDEADSELEAAQAEWVRLRNFLIGAGKVARSEAIEDPRSRRQLLDDAISFLEKSRDDGFPAGRRADGNRLLGETLFKVGRYDEATDALKAAIERDRSLARMLQPELAQAQLRSLQPTSEQSLATIDRYLSDSTLTVAQQQNGRVIRIQALIALDRLQQANDVIDQSLATSDSNGRNDQSEFRDKIKLLRAIVQVRKADQKRLAAPPDAEGKRNAIISIPSETMNDLDELQREATAKTALRARLWLARALLLRGDFEDFLSQSTTVRQQRPFGAEGIVAGLEEIEWLASQGRGLEMLLTTRSVVREIGDAQGFDASLIGYEKFRQRLRDAVDQLRNQGDFEHAIDAARSLPPIFTRSEALMQEGLVYREWADVARVEGTDVRGEISRSASMRSRRYFRAAGDAFAEAAQLEFDTPQYLQTQWLAIDAYQQGRHFSRTIELLVPYLRYERRGQRPRGLITLGRALLAVGNPKQAIDELTNCIIESPRDPLRYDARLLSALAHAELGNLENAKTLLLSNLDDGELTPQSPAYRDSLFTLGELLYRQGYENHLNAQRLAGAEKLELLRSNQPTLEHAVRRLDVAVIRYPTTQRAEYAAYLSASAHVLASRLPQIESRSPEILDAARRTLVAQAKTELQTALDGFEDLRDHLINREEEENRLPETEQAMLRNCFLRIADTLREMDNRLSDAAAAYREVSLRFMNEPPALEAILGQARCFKELGRHREADLLIRQAGAILKRIPQEWNGRFDKTTRFDRAGWEQLLSWMTSRLDVAEGGVS